MCIQSKSVNGTWVFSQCGNFLTGYDTTRDTLAARVTHIQVGLEIVDLPHQTLQLLLWIVSTSPSVSIKAGLKKKNHLFT